MKYAKDAIKVEYDTWHEDVRVQVKLRPECLADLMLRNEKELIDYDCSGPPNAWVYGKCEPWGGFSACWSLKETQDNELILTLPINRTMHFLDSDYKKRNPLCDLDIWLAALVAIKSHVKPEEILI